MKLSKKMAGVLVLILTLFLAEGCATDGSKKLDQKLATEPVIANSAELTKEVQTNIDQDKTLTPEQKVKLTKLRVETSTELKRLREQSLRLRDILIKDFEAENDKEIDIIHDRLQDNSNRQIEVIFDTIRKANSIIGHIPQNREWVNMMFMEGLGRY